MLRQTHLGDPRTSVLDETTFIRALRGDHVISRKRVVHLVGDGVIQLVWAEVTHLTDLTLGQEDNLVVGAEGRRSTAEVGHNAVHDTDNGQTQRGHNGVHRLEGDDTSHRDLCTAQRHLVLAHQLLALGEVLEEGRLRHLHSTEVEVAVLVAKVHEELHEVVLVARLGFCREDGEVHIEDRHALGVVSDRHLRTPVEHEVKQHLLHALVGRNREFTEVVRKRAYHSVLPQLTSVHSVKDELELLESVVVHLEAVAHVCYLKSSVTHRRTLTENLASIAVNDRTHTHCRGRPVDGLEQTGGSSLKAHVSAEDDFATLRSQRTVCHCLDKASVTEDAINS